MGYLPDGAGVWFGHSPSCDTEPTPIGCGCIYGRSYAWGCQVCRDVGEDIGDDRALAMRRAQDHHADVHGDDPHIRICDVDAETTPLPDPEMQ